MAALRFGKVGLAAIIDTREERIFRRSWRIARSMNVRGGTLPQSTANGGVCQWFSGPVGVRDAHAALRIRQSWHAESGAADAKLQPGHLEIVTDDADGDVGEVGDDELRGLELLRAVRGGESEQPHAGGTRRGGTRG